MRRLNSIEKSCLVLAAFFVVGGILLLVHPVEMTFITIYRGRE
jgi:hypothetical protein